MLYQLSIFCIMVTVTISYRILDSYSESACAIQGLGVSSAFAACGHVDSVDSVEGRTLEIRNVLENSMERWTVPRLRSAKLRKIFSRGPCWMARRKCRVNATERRFGNRCFWLEINPKRQSGFPLITSRQGRQPAGGMIGPI